MLDQRRLPLEEHWCELTTPEAVAEAIREMVVRGAPAIGIAAAFGMALAATAAAAAEGTDAASFDARLAEAARLLCAARPTAVNLAWAVRALGRTAHDARAAGLDNRAIARRLEDEAHRIAREDLAACRAIGRHGAALVSDGARILTHCNAGGLATGGYGTALGVVRAAVADGKRIRVLVDETRPVLQGARLTVWELMRDGIETVLIADSAAASLMRAGEIDLVVVGADRIAANGDVANKIGTYSVAILARAHDVPFYVAAPRSTIDLDCPTGDAIPIEERDGRELTELFGQRLAPPGVVVRNPAFDITPAAYVTAIVTEGGIVRAPYAPALAALGAPPRSERP